MNKARLIKKAKLAEHIQHAPSAQQVPAQRQFAAHYTQCTLTQWVGAFRNSRPQNPTAAFAALFSADA
jgi:hypothetical protein